MWSRIRGVSSATLELARHLRKPYYFGFLEGHWYLSEFQQAAVRRVFTKRNVLEVVENYESQFAKCVGPGFAISFAAGRMGFFTLMRVLGIGPGDEVILPAFTCSVMVNAVYRVGATPIFADIDEHTLGSSASGIAERISSNTKLVVAQHSFGIPCEISSIVDLARSHGFVLVEDCAIAFDSSINGIKVGNWGDAAIFSTDHSKPLNTMLGGILYTKDRGLHERMRAVSVHDPELAPAHQERLYQRFLFEASNFVPDRYASVLFSNFVRGIARKLFLKTHERIFLEADVRRKTEPNPYYPYPARMPSFLAQVGLYELERWPEERERRKILLRKYLELVDETNSKNLFPSAYFSPQSEIVPFRLAFMGSEGTGMMERAKEYIDTNWIWFRSPVVYCPEGPGSMGYPSGSCVKAEEITRRILNWPTAFPPSWTQASLDSLRHVLSCISGESA